jgi:choline dehydrogenase-like flavoprotein
MCNVSRPAAEDKGDNATMKAAVVGAGIMGAAAARALARNGYDVTLYEQFEIGHTRGSSHGRSRIVRLAYPDLEFVELAKESFAGWRELEREAGVDLLELNGLIELVGDLAQGSSSSVASLGFQARPPTRPVRSTSWSTPRLRAAAGRSASQTAGRRCFSRRPASSAPILRSVRSSKGRSHAEPSCASGRASNRSTTSRPTPSCSLRARG